MRNMLISLSIKSAQHIDAAKTQDLGTFSPCGKPEWLGYRDEDIVPVTC